MPVSDILKEISPEARLVLLIAKWVVSNQHTLDIKDILAKYKFEWRNFKELIAYHELDPYAYLCLKKYPCHVPSDNLKLLENNYYYCITHLSCLWEEFKHISNMLGEKNIISLPLKGIAFIADNMYADKTCLRPMCDIDILIKKKDLSPAKKILESSGYEENSCGMRGDYWREKSYHVEFIKRREGKPFYNVEIHWALDYKRRKPLLLSLWDRIKKTQVEDREVYMLSPEDTLFSLALHQRRFGKMLCLKNVCDVARLLNKHNADIDWDYILKEAKLANMSTTLYFILAQANLLFDIQFPPSLLKALNVPGYKKRLIRRFIAEDTFSSNLGLSNVRKNINNLYLKSHFLLYDNFWEPVKYILDIPQEQFAKFYGLLPYAKKTSLLYRFRYFYFINNFFKLMLKAIYKRLLRLLKP
jgi:hypothetical protein